MSENKSPIRLIAEKIIFTNFSIIYQVVTPDAMLHKTNKYFICSPDDICEKDLILKPTLLSAENMKVVYTPNNVTPHFYQNLLDKSINNYDEYKTELKYIYAVGEVVGFILP